jgi:hypothetical protein
MNRQAKPRLEPRTVERLYHYRELRNASEHNAAIPSIGELYEAIQETRHLILTYLPVKEDQLSRVKPPGAQINLTEYLDLHNYSCRKGFDFGWLSIPKDKAIEAAVYLAKASAASTAASETLNLIMRSQRRNVIQIRTRDLLPPEQWAVLARLSELGLISKLERHSERELIGYIPTSADYSFMAGVWLEIYVWYEATKCIDIHNQPLFDDCSLRFELVSKGEPRKEIDFGCMYRGHLVFGSCKTTQHPFKSSYLDELRAIGSLIGDLTCARLFITNTLPRKESSSRRNYERFVDYAEEHRIVVVAGTELTDIGKILKQEAQLIVSTRV